MGGSYRSSIQNYHECSLSCPLSQLVPCPVLSCHIPSPVLCCPFSSGDERSSLGASERTSELWGERGSDRVAIEWRASEGGRGARERASERGRARASEGERKQGATQNWNGHISAPTGLPYLCPQGFPDIILNAFDGTFHEKNDGPISQPPIL